MGDKPNSIPSVRCTDGTSRYKYRLDGISFTFKITANGFNNILLPSFKYRLTPLRIEWTDFPLQSSWPGCTIVRMPATFSPMIQSGLISCMALSM